MESALPDSGFTGSFRLWNEDLLTPEPRWNTVLYNRFKVDTVIFAKPWWVNLLLLVPFGSLYFWRRERLAIAGRTLILAAAFAASFGMVEAISVDYLRGNIAQIHPIQTTDMTNPDSLHLLPAPLLRTESFREAATMVMLIAVPCLGTARARERWALFLWCFAIWDLMYYVGLRVTIHWPASLRDLDVLFLIPEPWFAEVWYPVVVSAATLAAVMLGRKRSFANSPST